MKCSHCKQVSLVKQYKNIGVCAGCHQDKVSATPPAPSSADLVSLESARKTYTESIVKSLSDLSKLQAPDVKVFKTLTGFDFHKINSNRLQKQMFNGNQRKFTSNINSNLIKKIIVGGDDNEIWLGSHWIAEYKNGSKVQYPLIKRRCVLNDDSTFSFVSSIDIHAPLEDLLNTEKLKELDTDGRNQYIQDCLKPYNREQVHGLLSTKIKPTDLLIDSQTLILYLAPKSKSTEASKDLERWVQAENVENTALAEIYMGDIPLETPSDQPIASLLPLNERQRVAILKARNHPITAISGPPGCGKSHTLVALAIDKLANGETVLIATQNEHAQRAILEILKNVPEIPYLVFGNPDMASLSLQVDRMRNAPPYRFTTSDLQTQELEVAQLKSNILEALSLEEDVEKALLNQGLLHLVDDIGLNLRDEDLDVEKVIELLASARNIDRFLGGFKSKRAKKKLYKIIGSRPSIDLEEIETAVDKVISHRNMQRFVHAGGLDLNDTWTQLRLSQARLDHIIAEDFSRQLRENSNARNWDSLNNIKYGNTTNIDFLAVAPMWIGTLNEIEKTLPNVAGMFDTVILDEASQISQTGAAPALLRSKKAVIVGDEKQLSHVSFISNEAIERAIAKHHIPQDLALKLDVRGKSVMAVASDYPVTWLNEHFRSTPHIIDFSNQHFYNDGLKLMTAHPTNEISDAIDVEQVEGTRVRGVNKIEVQAAIKQIRSMQQLKEQSIGVISPFRKQVEAIQEAVLKEFSLREIQEMDLRIGTVHGFQGSERTNVILSLAVDNTSPSSLRFIQDPNLFNVMVTRAKNRMHVITSFDANDLPAGLLRYYMDYEKGYEKSVDKGYAKRVWTSKLEEMLKGSDRRVIVDYATGDHVIDLVVGTGDKAIAVETAVHSEGPEKHFERREALEKAGWRVVEAFQSKWNLEEAQLAVMLIDITE